MITKNSLENFRIKEGIFQKYLGREESVTVPEGIHTIGEGAFKGCVSLRQVTLPKSLRQIEANAFKGCRKLEEIQIPHGVTKIGDYAFHRCHSLKEIHLPVSVTKTGNCAFLYCDSLVKACIPGVLWLGRQTFLNDVLLEQLEISPLLDTDCLCDVFNGCQKLSEITFYQDSVVRFPNVVEVMAGAVSVPPLVHAIAADVLQMMELNGRCLTRFLTNLKHVEIPEGITKIGKSCFFDKRGIVSVKLPATLTEIESRAFRNCICLEKVQFASSQVHIHEDAFKNCSSLKEIQLENNASFTLAGISQLSGSILPSLVQTIHRQVLGNFSISGTILLKYLGDESRVVVPEGITRIGQEAFAGKEEIDQVRLPESLVEIGAGAFRDCLTMQSIFLPEKLSYIGTSAFENCVKLIRLSLPDGITQVKPRTFKRCQVLREIHFGNALTAIGKEAFYGCSNLKEVPLNPCLSHIGEMAFYRCASLKEVRLFSHTEKIGNLAFAQTGIRRVTIVGSTAFSSPLPSGSLWGTGIFSRCLRLKSLILEEGLCHLPDKFVYQCTALTQIFTPSSLKSIGRQVMEGTPFLENWISRRKNAPWDAGEIFWDGRDLKNEVFLTDNFRILAGGAFWGNSSITSLRLPNHVQWIGPGAFKGCLSLRQVVLPPSVTRLEEEVFCNCRQLTLLFVSHDEPAPFPRAFQWVGRRTFYHCEQLSSVSFRNLTFMGEEAFAGCKKLDSKKVKEELEESAAAARNEHKKLYIGERAFEDSPVLDSSKGELAILGSVVIDGSACQGNVILPQGVTAIAPFAFWANQEITHIQFPKSLCTIEEGAFAGCSRLTSIAFPETDLHLVIHNRAFEKCTSLTEIHIPASWIGPSAFAWCTALKKAFLPEIDVLNQRLFEGCHTLKECVCPKVSQISSWCFCGCKNLESFDFQSVHEIGSYAFEGCDCLTEATFEDQTLLHAYAMKDCGRLKKISLSGPFGTLFLGEYALSGCTALKQVNWQKETWRFTSYGQLFSGTFPDRAGLIFQSAISCFTINQKMVLCSYEGAGRILSIPHGVTEIQAEVFRDKMMLEEVQIPNTVILIGARAFHGTEWMRRQKQRSPMVVVNHMLLDGSSCTGNILVPEEIRIICGWAFANGLEIRRIQFPSSKIKVEEYAFRNCINLKEIQLWDQKMYTFGHIADQNRPLPALVKQAVTDSLNCFKTSPDGALIQCTGNIPVLSVANGITAIGDRVFEDSNLLTEITLPPTVQTIGKMAFLGCKWLKEVKGAENVSCLGERAFSGCKCLERISLSYAFRKLGPRAFENCTSLQEIILPEGVEEIPARAFFRCHSLRHVHLPSTIQRIGPEAFAFCNKLHPLLIPPGTEVGERAFVL